MWLPPIFLKQQEPLVDDVVSLINSCEERASEQADKSNSSKDPRKALRCPPRLVSRTNLRRTDWRGLARRYSTVGEKTQSSKSRHLKSSPSESLSCPSDGSGGEEWPKEKEGSRKRRDDVAGEGEGVEELKPAEVEGLEPIWIPDDESQGGTGDSSSLKRMPSEEGRWKGRERRTHRLGRGNLRRSGRALKRYELSWRSTSLWWV
jgi:hypothetical protein